jgi:hypothetical protein
MKEESYELIVIEKFHFSDGRTVFVGRVSWIDEATECAKILISEPSAPKYIYLTIKGITR